MGKLSALIVVVVALLVGGCAGQVEGPEVFEFRTFDSGVYPRALEAAEQINAEDPDVFVDVQLLSPGYPAHEGLLENLDGMGDGAGTDQTNVGIWATPKTHVLRVGSEATLEAIQVGMYDWIAMFSTRED